VGTISVQLVEKTKTLKDGGRAVYYLLRWYGTHGQLQERSLGRSRASGGDVTRTAAKEARRALESELSGGRRSLDNPRQMTAEEFVDHYCDAFGHNARPSAVDSWRHALRHLAAAIGGRRKMHTITFADAATLRRYMKDDRGASDATARKTVSIVKTALGRAIDLGVIDHNPFARIKAGAPPAAPSRPLTLDQIAAVYAAAPNQWWETFLRVAVTSGLRKMELLHLRWDDVDLDADIPVVRVAPRPASVFTLAGEELPVFAWAPKSRHGVRSVPIPPDTVDAIRRMRLANPGSPYVFVGVDRLRRLRDRRSAGKLSAGFRILDNLKPEFDRIQARAAKAMKDENWQTRRIHDLRQTYGTHAATKVPMPVLRELMGHSSITTTADFYAGVLDESRAAAARVFVA